MWSSLSPQLPICPQVIFKKERNIKNLIAPSKVGAKSQKKSQKKPSSFLSLTGLYRCNKKRRKTCAHMEHQKNIFLIQKANHMKSVNSLVALPAMWSMHLHAHATSYMWVGLLDHCVSVFVNIKVVWRRGHHSLLSPDIFWKNIKIQRCWRLLYKTYCTSLHEGDIMYLRLYVIKKPFGFLNWRVWL